MNNHNIGFNGETKKYLRGMFEMNSLLSSSSISTWGTIKTNTCCIGLFNIYTAVYKCSC